MRSEMAEAGLPAPEYRQNEFMVSFGTSLTFAFLRQIQALTNDFWTLRDNSIYVRDGFLFVYDKAIEDGVTFKASLSAINTWRTPERDRTRRKGFAGLPGRLHAPADEIRYAIRFGSRKDQ